jgi:hypothetical protein
VAAFDDGILGGDCSVGANTQNELRLQGMFNLVCCEGDELVLMKMCDKKVGKRVVFLVEGEDGGVFDACSDMFSAQSKKKPE